MGDTHLTPSHGWTCFHCGETFTTYEAARDHFGITPAADPGCRVKLGAERGLLMALRKAEASNMSAWSALHEESTDAIRALRAAEGRFSAAIMQAEEAGYERGLSDGRREALRTQKDKEDE